MKLISGKHNHFGAVMTTLNESEISNKYLGQQFTDAELVIGFVCAVGTEQKIVNDMLCERLNVFGYTTNEIHISTHIIKDLFSFSNIDCTDEYRRISESMDAGNTIRFKSKENSILAMGAAAKINSSREKDDGDNLKYKSKNAYIISSLKHPEEVKILRDIYTNGFFLIGIYSDESRRLKYLTEDKKIKKESAIELIKRDADEHLDYGQRTSDTFYLSDFFIHLTGNNDKVKNSIWRILDLIFGHPYITPTFDEYTMFMAYSASLRSADLSRQVGAVIAKNEEIISSGANDCPRFGGGLYWPFYDENEKKIIDTKNGRDYTRGRDSNKIEKEKLMNEIALKFEVEGVKKEKTLDILSKTRIDDITEYGRVVHAEMEAIITCSRNNIITKGGTLYCTTFPCHNCAKHIIAAGIERVVYVEPYPKSKAADFHDDSISLGFSDGNKTIHFEPFVGVGPRRFFDLFSMNLGSGYSLQRKDQDGKTIDWKPNKGRLRIQMLPCSYLDIETATAVLCNTIQKELNHED